MLESKAILRTWALPERPQVGQAVVADALADHRTEYLSYEGSVSGERGHVTQWDRGEYTVLKEHDDCLTVRLSGDQLRCELTIARDREDSTRWHFRFGGEAQLR